MVVRSLGTGNVYGGRVEPVVLGEGMYGRERFERYN